MIKAGFISLGCAKNLVDTEVMLGILQENHVELTDKPEEAQVIIVNTCGFIDSAKEESIEMILKMAQYKKKGICKGLIIAGCLGQRYGQELFQEMPEADALIGTGSWHRVMEAVNAVMAGQRIIIIDDNTTLYDAATPRVQTTPFYSAYVKISEGCSNACSYCIIPHIRGPQKSRTIESIVQETARLVQSGVKEINLIAQDTTCYGEDLYGRPRLTDLLKELVKIEGTYWIRMLYCYPYNFSDDLIELMAQESKICHYVDLPLQHVHNEILEQMNRPDRYEDIIQLLEKLKRKIPDIVLRTSYIVGFPGESDEQFAFLKEFVQDYPFHHVGVFIYSQEEGTVAAEMPGQIPEEIKQERYHQLMAIQSKISEELNQKAEGQVVTVLLEGHHSEQPEIVYGRSYREAPDVDGSIYIENYAEGKAGELIQARIIQGFTYDILAEKVEI